MMPFTPCFRHLHQTLFPAALVALACAFPQDLPAATSLEPYLIPTTILVVAGNPEFRGTVGYDFQFNEPKEVFQLGFWDHLEDGLLSSHRVSLFDGSGTPLASAVVPSGAGARLQDGFRWVAIPGIVLPAGSYVIAGSTEGDPAVFDEVVTDAASIATATGVVFGQARVSNPVDGGASIGDLFPANLEGGAGYFGPSLAPGPLPVLGAGAAWAWSRRLRARCKERDQA